MTDRIGDWRLDRAGKKCYMVYDWDYESETFIAWFDTENDACKFIMQRCYGGEQ